MVWRVHYYATTDQGVIGCLWLGGNSLQVIQLLTHDMQTTAMKIISHAAKEEAKSDFLTFIDVNSQPHGNMEEVLIALQQLLFSPKFCTVQTAKRGVTNYKERGL